MALRDLERAGLMRLGPASATPASTRRSGLIFVLDRSYLDSLKVLLFSLGRTGSFLDLPIFILTQDAAVAGDPVLKQAADRIRLIAEDEIGLFRSVASGRVPEQYRLDWIAKYTFLKWLIFDDWDLDQLVFIDADIVCLNRADPILDAGGDADLVCGPRFLDTLFRKADGTLLPERSIFRNLRAMAKGVIPKDHGRLNSGVMVIRGKVLTRAFRERLLDFASRKEYVNEQSYLTGYFQTPREETLASMSPAYNFGAGALAHLSTARQIALLKRITFLHFPGPRKPWLAPFAVDQRLTHLIWQKIAYEARRDSDLLGPAKAAPREAVSAQDM